jgi:hypothetical protein
MVERVRDNSIEGGSCARPETGRSSFSLEEARARGGPVAFRRSGGVRWVVVAALALVHVITSVQASFYTGQYADEDLPVLLSRRIWHSGELDTNWVHSPELAQHYPGDQFTFSSFIVVLQLPALVLDVLGQTEGPDAEKLELFVFRVMAALFTGLAFVPLFLAFRRLADDSTALCALALVFFSTQLFQDSIYARAESFILLLFAGALALAVSMPERSRRRKLVQTLLLGTLFGLLVTCKISMVFTCAHLSLVAMTPRPSVPASTRWDDVRSWLLDALTFVGVLGLGFVIGFALGAPYGLVHPLAFLSGANFQIHHYAGAHLPFGRPNEGFAGRFSYGMGYLLATNGAPLLLFAALGLALWVREAPLVAAVVAGPALFYIVSFLQNGVFFERNFSVYLPVLYLLAAIGVVRVARGLPRAARIEDATTRRLTAMTVLAGVLVLPAALWVRFAFLVAPNDDWRVADLESHRAAAEATIGAPVEVRYCFDLPTAHSLVKQAKVAGRRVYEIRGFHDPYTAEQVWHLRTHHGFRLFEEVRGPLYDLPQSMLHYNHSWDTTFLLPPGVDVPVGSPTFGSVTGVCQRANPVPVVAMKNFTPGGAHPSVMTSAAPRMFRGSWLGSDEPTGRIEIGPVTLGEGLSLPFVTGPTSARQKIELVSVGSGAVVASLSGVTARDWIAWRLPESDEVVHIVATDAGSAWGEWIAIGEPGRETGRNGCGLDR